MNRIGTREFDPLSVFDELKLASFLFLFLFLFPLPESEANPDTFLIL